MRIGIMEAERNWMGHMKTVRLCDDAPFKTFGWSKSGQAKRRVQQLPLDIVGRLRLDDEQEINVGDVPAEGVLRNGAVEVDADEIFAEDFLHGVRQIVEQAGKFPLVVLRC